MKLSFSRDYEQLNQDEGGIETGEHERKVGLKRCDSTTQRILPSSLFERKSAAWNYWATFISPLLVLCLIISNMYAWRNTRSQIPGDSVYSPATSAIKYKNVVFQAGIDSDTSPYQGPLGGESDVLWEELHKYGVTKIPQNEAAQLANRTSPIPGDEGNYVVILEVFHELHCLSHVRRRLFWDEATMGDPNDDHALALKHLDHCIDSIRQSLMCSADVTPLPYVWWRKYDQLMPASAVTHTCRDFDAIRDWAKERLAGKIDAHVQVHDPLGDAVMYDV